MKKLFIMASSLLLLLILIPSAYANEVHFDVDIQNQFTIKNTDIGSAVHQTSYFHDDNDWTYEPPIDFGDTYIYVTSPRVYADADYLQYVQIPNYTVYLDGSVEVNAYDHAYVYIYDSETAIFPSSIITLTNFGPGGQSSYRLLTPRALNGPKYIQIRLAMGLNANQKGYQVLNNTHPKVKADFDFHAHPSIHNSHNRLRYYTASTRLSFNHGWADNVPWLSGKNFHSTVTLRNTTGFTPPVDPSDYDSVSDLPPTAGSIFSNFFGMGRVYFEASENNLIAKVEYQTNEWYIPFTMAVGTDMSIFNNVYETFYYQYEGQKFFLINHGQQSMFTSNNLRTQTWIDYTIWNLTTNEINTFERFNVYLYSKMEEANNVYGYFYVDEFVIDHLLSATLAMRYQNVYLFGDNGPWVEYHKILEAGVQESFDPTSWQADVLIGTAAATTVLSFIPVVQLPALLIGSAIMGWVGSTIQQPPISFGTINQIQKITPTSSLRNEINSAYTANNPNFSGVNNNLNLFKLYIGQFNDFWATGINIDTEYSLFQEQKGINIIQFTYMTEGQIYTIDGEDIKLIFTPGPGTDGESPNIPLPKFNISAIAGIAVGAIVAVVIVVGAASNGAFISKRKGFNFGVFIGTVLGALFAAVLLGVIVWLFVEYLFTGDLINLFVLR